jgi:hypothetical protein
VQRICAEILQVAQATLRTARWLGQVGLIFKLIYYVYVYVIII